MSQLTQRDSDILEAVMAAVQRGRDMNPVKPNPLQGSVVLSTANSLELSFPDGYKFSLKVEKK
jgi:hypothetical protein